MSRPRRLFVLLLLASWIGVGGRVWAAEPLRLVHVLVVLDTDDYSIGETLEKDQKNLEALLAAQFPRGRVRVRTLKGKEATAEAVVGHFRGLKLSTPAEEGVALLFGGHGKSNPRGEHFLLFTNGSQKQLRRGEIRAEMEKTGAGLVVLLTDCCSNVVEEKKNKKRSGGVDEPASPPGPVTRSGTNPLVMDLFYRSRGTVNITAASEDFAYCDNGGGVFTRALCRTLTSQARELDRNGDGHVAWGEAFAQIQVNTRTLFQQMQKADRELQSVKIAQTPKSFALGGSAGEARYAVVGLENLAGFAVSYRYRWEGEEAWRPGVLARSGHTVHQLPLTGDVAPPLEIFFAGQPKSHTVPSKLWKGSRKPTLADGKRIPVRVQKKSRGGPPPVGIELESSASSEEVRVTVRGGGKDAAVARATLWIGDVALPTAFATTGGQFERKGLALPPGLLLPGANRVTVVGYSEDGERRESSIVLDRSAPAPGKGTLYALCVGLDDHTGIRGALLPDTRTCEGDAKLVAGVLEKQAGGLYGACEVKLLTGKDVQAGAILRHLAGLAGRVKRNDRVVVYLAGQNASPEVEGLRVSQPFALACTDSDASRLDSWLGGAELCRVLAALPCHKTLFLDAAGTEELAAQAAHLFPANAPLQLFGSCRRGQSPLDPPGEGVRGYFARALAGSLESSRGQAVTVEGLGKRLEAQLKGLLRDARVNGENAPALPEPSAAVLFHTP